MPSSEPLDDAEVPTKKKDSPRVSDTEWSRWVNRVRDVFFLTLGLAGTANQLFYANPPNPVLYPILASLLGAPFALALDERRRNSRDDKEEK